MKKIVLCFLFLSQFLFAQKEIKGIVSDDLGVLMGASVIVEGTTLGTETDENGMYTISAKTGQVLEFSYVGNKTVKIKVKKSSKINVMMEMSSENVLDAVVVTGITKTDKRIFTGAAVKIKLDDVKVGGLPDISRSLEGRASGVSVQNVSGTFGSAPKIRIRGATSIYGNSKPLWVVDGVVLEDIVELTADDLASGDALTLISSAVAGLNPEDIESFNVLKDASATSIYGSKAMAGVIVITTKKGKAGVSTLNYNSSFTYRAIPRYSDFNIMNSQDQMEVYQEMERSGYLGIASLKGSSNSGVYGKMYEELYTLDTNGDFVLSSSDQSKLMFLRKAEQRNTDWFKEMFNVGILQTHAVSMSSGSDKSTYYASLSGMFDPGWTKQSNAKRYTANFNASYKLSDKLKLNLNSSGSFIDQREANQRTSEERGTEDIGVNPFNYALNSSRTLGVDEYYKKGFTSFNALKELEENFNEVNRAKVKFQGDLTWKISKDLSAMVLASNTYSTAKTDTHITEFSNSARSYRVMSPDLVRNANGNLYKDPDKQYSLPEVILPEGGFYTSTVNQLKSNTVRATLLYNKNIDNTHIINTLFGIDVNSADRQKSWSRGVGMQYSMGEIPFFDYKYFKNIKEKGENYYGLTNTSDRSMAYIANATYSYKSKYTINGTMRYEGSNQLGKSKASRWLPNWNVSGSWNVDDEDFFNSLKPAFSRLSFKTSYGLTSQRGPASNSTMILRNRTPWRNSADVQEGSLFINALENSNLTYEKKKELNLGAELGFINDRITMNIDWYTRDNYDLIGKIYTQGIGGKIAKLGNVATMKSSGAELSLSTTNIKTKNFSWTTNFVYAKATNEITKLEDRSSLEDLLVGNRFSSRVGYPMGAVYSMPFKGLNNEGLPTFTNRDKKTTISDINFNERKKLNHLVYSGPKDPTDTGGFGNNFKYKGLSLNVFLSYSFGSVVRLQPFFNNDYTDLDAMPKDFKNRWIVPGDEKITNIPAIATARQNENDPRLAYAYVAYNYSDARVAKGDFIRLKDVSLGYKFNKKVTKSAGLSNLSIGLQATNLFLVYSDKKLKGQDPEFVNSGGVAKPNPKQFTFTIKAGL